MKIIIEEKKSPGGCRGDREKKSFTIPIRSLTDFDEKVKYQKAFDKVLSEADLTEFGLISLHLHIENGGLVRYRICGERSFLAGGEK
jgi:hypothetical protein